MHPRRHHHRAHTALPLLLALFTACAAAPPAAPPVVPAPAPPIADEDLVSKDTILAYAGDELPAREVAVLSSRFTRDADGSLTVTRIEAIDGLPVEDPPAADEPQRPLAILPGTHRVQISFRLTGDRAVASTAAEEVVLDAAAGHAYEATFEIRNLDLPAGRPFHGREPEAATTDPRLRWAPLLVDTQRTARGATQ